MVIHAELKDAFDSKACRALMTQVEVTFAPDRVIEDAIAAAGVAAVLPTFCEPQRWRMAEIRRSRPDAILVALVRDLDGINTLKAFRAGASRVANLMLGPDQVIAALMSCSRTANGAADGHLAPGSVSADVVFPSPDDSTLTRLLRSGATFALIARITRCSERTLYRRAREIYRQRGVSCRAELRRLPE